MLEPCVYGLGSILPGFSVRMAVSVAPNRYLKGVQAWYIFEMNGKISELSKPVFSQLVSPEFYSARYY